MLGRLGPRVVLDVWPAPREDEIPGPYQDLLIPGHYLLAIDVSADSIRTQGLNTDTLRASMTAGRLRLAYRGSEKNLVLLDTTAALRAKLSPYLARKGVLDEPTVWRRGRGRR